MKLLTVLLAILISGCCTYITKQDAIRIAKEEIKRRSFPLPAVYVVDATRATPITESGPEVPLYMVTFNQPDRSPTDTLYEIDVNRCTGKIEAFGDLRKSHLFRVSGAAIEQKRDGRWVPVRH